MTEIIVDNPVRRLFGWLALVLFVTFAGNVLISKLSTVNHWALPRVPGVVEFLVLFLATGCFVAYAAFAHMSDAADPRP